MTEGAPARAWAGSTRRSRLPTDWQTIRTRVLQRDRGVCQIRGPRCTHRATEVDHVIAGDDHRDEALQAACTPCHRDKSSAEGNSARRRERRVPGRHPGLL